VRNRFHFAVTTGSAFMPKLRKDWDEFGAEVFTYAVLEELDQKPGQSEAEFRADLETLEQLCRANLDVSNAY